MKIRPEVFDIYWYFAAERQAIFYRKLNGQIKPWTADPTLANYKFCNVYRAADRVSQFLINSVLYDGKDRSEADILFRTLLFRLLNKTQTWILLEQELGSINLDTFSFDRYNEVLTQLKLANPIYGNAFILCPTPAFGYSIKHQNHLALLQFIFQQSDIGQQLVAAKSLEELFMLLKSLPLFGDFMAYQLAIDCNYSTIFDFSENDFTVAGPGAKRGIAKCFVSTDNLSASEVIMWMVEHQEEEFAKRGLDFQKLGDRPLQAIDCQGLFCEVDKYCRVKFPNLASNRSKIKATYRADPTTLSYRFPPKWNITLENPTLTSS